VSLRLPLGLTEFESAIGFNKKTKKRHRAKKA